MNMRKILYVFSCLIVSMCGLLNAQEGELINNEAIKFEIKSDSGDIDFVLFDTVTTEIKPVFLFCQGSLPMPLFIETNDGSVFTFGGGISNFDYNKIKEEYHLIVISMPETPVYCKMSELNDRYEYVTDPQNPKSYKKEYLLADYLENYVDRAEIVIKFLHKQEWVNSDKLVVFGHSQGSHIATVLASHKENRITHLGLSGANPFGRIDISVRRARDDEKKGRISSEEAENRINEEYKYWEYICDKENRAQNSFLIPWYSFSKPTIDELLKVNVPIYLTYGTEDITSDLCDLVPLFFTYEGKENLTVKRHWGLEHNYFEVDENGNMIVENCHWTNVMYEFLDWIK